MPFQLLIVFFLAGAAVGHSPDTGKRPNWDCLTQGPRLTLNRDGSVTENYQDRGACEEPGR